MEYIDRAIEHMKDARDLLVDAEARHAADAVRRALKSADGAQRHARRLLAQSEAQEWTADDPPVRVR